MATQTRSNFIQAILDLCRFERGHATFTVSADGELEHTGTVTTVKMKSGETLQEFHVRLRTACGLQPGDTIELLNNGGKCDTARITHRR